MDIKAILLRLVLIGAAFPPGLVRADPLSLLTTALASPAGPGANQAALTAAGDGSLWLTWLEPAAAGSSALRGAAFDPVRNRWRPAVTVARGDGFVREPGNLPAFAASADGRAAVAWTVLAANGPGQCVMLSQSSDGGHSWSPPARLSPESTDAASPALATLADGHLAAVWLDRRARSGDGRGLGLYVRLLGPEATSDQLLDPEAAAGAQPVLAALLDGSALVAYAGRHPGSPAQPRVLRWHRQQWGQPHEIDAEPDDGGDALNGGPRIAVDGGRVGAVWTPRGGEARLLVSASPDAGRRFQLPVSAGLGETQAVNFTLKVAAGKQDITVSSEAPLINVENPNTTTTLTARGLEDLPNPGGDLTYPAQFAPGALINTAGSSNDFVGSQNGYGNVQFNRLPALSNAYIVDGLETNDPLTNPADPDAVSTATTAAGRTKTWGEDCTAFLQATLRGDIEPT